MFNLFRKRLLVENWFGYESGDQWRRNELKSGGICPARSARKHCRATPLFGGSTSTISRFGERFCDGQYSLASFLFAVLLPTVPRAQSFVKVGGGHVPPCHMSRRHWWKQCISPVYI